jgi:hypothetical protein
MIGAGRPDAGDVVLNSRDPDRRRVVIDALMTVPVRSPGQGARRFRPETVEIIWRKQR